MKAVLAIGAVVVIAIIAYRIYEGSQRPVRGYEVEPAAQHAYLSKALSEELGFEGLKVEWIRESWVNGFQDHTRLYELALPPDELARLRQGFDSASGSDVPFVFREGNYLGPSTAPDWWDAKAIDALPQLVHDGGPRNIRLNAEGEVGYLLILH